MKGVEWEIEAESDEITGAAGGGGGAAEGACELLGTGEVDPGVLVSGDREKRIEEAEQLEVSDVGVAIGEVDADCMGLVEAAAQREGFVCGRDAGDRHKPAAENAAEEIKIGGEEAAFEIGVDLKLEGLDEEQEAVALIGPPGAQVVLGGDGAGGVVGVGLELVEELGEFGQALLETLGERTGGVGGEALCE